MDWLVRIGARRSLATLALGVWLTACVAAEPSNAPAEPHPASSGGTALSEPTGIAMTTGTPLRCTVADPLECLKAHVEAMADRREFDGQILIAQDGRAIWEGVYGRDATGAPTTERTRLGIASAAKMLTAVATGQLVDAGKLAFGDRIGDHLDGLPPDVAASTIGSLLSHRSGLGMFDWSHGLAFPPGDFHYSNAGFALVDRAIEKASGKSIATYVRQRILEPAGMHDTAFGTGGQDGSTARDLLRFVNALLANQLVSAETTRELTKQKIATEFGGYAYGFAIFTGEGGETPSIGHIGAAPEIVAAVEISPPIGSTVIVLCLDGFASIEPAIVVYQKAIGMGYWRG